MLLQSQAIQEGGILSVSMHKSMGIARSDEIPPLGFLAAYDVHPSSHIPVQAWPIKNLIINN